MLGQTCLRLQQEAACHHHHRNHRPSAGTGVPTTAAAAERVTRPAPDPPHPRALRAPRTAPHGSEPARNPAASPVCAGVAARVRQGGDCQVASPSPAARPPARALPSAPAASPPRLAAPVCTPPSALRWRPRLRDAL